MHTQNTPGKTNQRRRGANKSGREHALANTKDQGSAGAAKSPLISPTGLPILWRQSAAVEGTKRTNRDMALEVRSGALT